MNFHRGIYIPCPKLVTRTLPFRSLLYSVMYTPISVRQQLKKVLHFLKFFCEITVHLGVVIWCLGSPFYYNQCLKQSKNQQVLIMQFVQSKISPKIIRICILLGIKYNNDLVYQGRVGALFVSLTNENNLRHENIWWQQT